MTRNAWLSALSILAALTGCDATVVGEPIGKEGARSEGTGAGGSYGGTSPNGSSSSGAVEGTIMTQAEAAAWCTTYVYERHPRAQIETPPPAPANVYEGNALYGLIACNDNFLLFWPTVEDCVRNIVRTPCSATVAELDQCVDGIIDGWNAKLADVDAPCPVTGTCDAFLAANCDEVVVHQYTMGEGGSFGGLELE